MCAKAWRRWRCRAFLALCSVGRTSTPDGGTSTPDGGTSTPDGGTSTLDAVRCLGPIDQVSVPGPCAIYPCLCSSMTSSTVCVPGPYAIHPCLSMRFITSKDGDSGGIEGCLGRTPGLDDPVVRILVAGTYNGSESSPALPTAHGHRPAPRPRAPPGEKTRRVNGRRGSLINEGRAAIRVGPGRAHGPSPESRRGVAPRLRVGATRPTPGLSPLNCPGRGALLLMPPRSSLPWKSCGTAAAITPKPAALAVHPSAHTHPCRYTNSRAYARPSAQTRTKSRSPSPLIRNPFSSSL